MRNLTPDLLLDAPLEPRAAFRRADRRSRVFLAGVPEFFARATALRELGHLDAARRDLQRASEVDPTDPRINEALLQWGPEAERDDAAKRLLAHGSSSDAALEMAIQCLLRGKEGLAHRLQIVDGRRVVGWAVWGDGRTLTLEIDAEDGAQTRDIAPQPGHRWARFGLAASFDVAAPDEIREARLRLDGELRARAANVHGRDAHPLAAFPVTDQERSADHVLVIVPVYADLDATRACLDSLAKQTASIAIRTVVVDDGSPDREMQAYLDAACEGRGFALERNPRNLGFVGATNRGLMQHRGGDVLFLNADAALPEGAVERLRRAVYSAPDIGTATPFSNNGEFTSFPIPFRANPMPSPTALMALDRIFRDANAAQTIPIPSGVGFCLYVKRECFEAVGPFSPAYAPGYGEDSEFCLTARMRGYRHVCAADLFVGHAGSRSFGSAKRALVKRNIRMLEERFPDFRAECAAFLHADPLRQARARAERKLPPQAATRLLVIASAAYVATAEARARSLSRAEALGTVLALQIAGHSGRLELRAFGPGSPQGLYFDPRKETEALSAYLRASHIDRVEILGAGELSEADYGLLSSIGAPIDILCTDAWPLAPPLSARKGACEAEDVDAPCKACRSASDLTEETKDAFKRTLGSLRRILKDDSRVLPLDALAEAFAPYGYGRWPRGPVVEAKRRSVARSGLAVAVLSPTPSVAVDSLLKRLGREIRRAGDPADIVVFGGCLDDEAVMASGAVFVTGIAEPEAYEEMILTYEIGLVVSPYRKSHFWLFNSGICDLPKAYFDWSFGMLERQKGDLAMDPRVCDAKAAKQVMSWIRVWSGDAGGQMASA